MELKRKMGGLKGEIRFGLSSLRSRMCGIALTFLNSAPKNEIPGEGLTSGFFYFEEAKEVFPLVIELL